MLIAPQVSYSFTTRSTSTPEVCRLQRLTRIARRSPSSEKHLACFENGRNHLIGASIVIYFFGVLTRIEETH